MTRLRLVLLLVIAAGAVVGHAWQEPQFRAGTHTVSIYATVQDETGRLVTDLARGDFQVLDNGKPQELSVFASDIQPITIVIMLDRSGSMTWNFGLVRDAAEQFVLQLLPDDKARLGNFSNRIEIDPPTFTSDRQVLLQILHENLQEGGPTPLWNATSAAMNALQSETGRRVILMFTDGKDSPPNPFGNVTFSEVRDRSSKEEIMVYGIGLANTCGRSLPVPELSRAPLGTARFQRRGYPPPRGPMIPLPPWGGRLPPVGMPPPPHAPVRPGDPGSLANGSPCGTSKPDPDLAELAAVGGGGYFELHGTDDLVVTFKRIAEELHHQYLLGFTPAALDGQTHTLEVHVGRPGMTARARKSYVAADK